MVSWYHPLVWRLKPEFCNIGCFDELDSEGGASAARNSSGEWIQWEFANAYPTRLYK